MATLQAGYPADPEMTGRSILSAAMRTRVATRPGGNDAAGGGGPPEPSGGSVISGLGVAETATSGLAVGGRRRDRIGGGRGRERQHAGCQEGDPESGQKCWSDSRADPIREVAHGTGMVAAVLVEAPSTACTGTLRAT